MARTANLAPNNDRTSGVGGAFFMFMGQNHHYRPSNPKRNPWGGVVGLERAPKPVVTQTELSRDNPVPEPARKCEARAGYAGAPGGSLSYRDVPHPPAYPNPSRGAHSARGSAANVAGRDYMDELDGDYEYGGGGGGGGGGVSGADPSLDMWVTGTLLGAPKPRKSELVLPGIHSHRSPRSGGGGGGGGGGNRRPQHGAAAPNKRREGEVSLATQKKVDKAVKLIRSILSSWDSSLRKTFNTIDADRKPSRRIFIFHHQNQETSCHVSNL